MTETQKMHERLAHLHLNRIAKVSGDIKVKKQNDFHLKCAQMHIKRAGGEL